MLPQIARRSNRIKIAAVIGVGFLMGASATPSWASNDDYGYATYVYGLSNGFILFNSSGTRSTPLPSCASPAVPYRWALDGTTAAGQAQLSVFLTAYAAHKRIYIVGTGACPAAQADTEQVSLFVVEN